MKSSKPPAGCLRRGRPRASVRAFGRPRSWMAVFLAAAAVLPVLAPAAAQESESPAALGSAADAAGVEEGQVLQAPGLEDFISGGPKEWTSPKGLTSSLQVMLLLTVLTLAPAILLMTTSFVRIVIVLGLLRQALGAQQLPPSQVITSIALFMTLLIMAPAWTESYNEGLRPYTNEQIDLETAWKRAEAPIKRFMSRQIEVAGNSEDVWLFFEHLPESERSKVPETYDDVPLKVLLPAYMLSELKTAFLIGFQIYLPFLILDIVVASVTISMNMMMLPPTIVSLPFKLLLFVLVDGWNLVIGMLLNSFAPS